MLLFLAPAFVFALIFWVVWRDRNIFFGDDNGFHDNGFYDDERFVGHRHAPQRNASVCDHTRA